MDYKNQSVIYRYKIDADPESAEVFLDPNTFNEEGTISLGGMSFSDNGKNLFIVFLKEEVTGEKCWL